MKLHCQKTNKWMAVARKRGLHPSVRSLPYGVINQQVLLSFGDLAMESDVDANPYVATTAKLSDTHFRVDFGPIIRRWEQLRWLYNAILIGLVLLMTVVGFPQHMVDPAYWVLVVFGGVLANVCFLTGPAIEGYGTYFDFWNPRMTLLLFLAGLGLTAILAMGSIAGF